MSLDALNKAMKGMASESPRASDAVSRGVRFKTISIGDKEVKVPADESEKSFGQKTLSAIDKLNTVSYAIGGLMEGIGVKEGIKRKWSPSKVLDIENPAAAFATDVLTDPTTYMSLGIGAGLRSVAKVGGKVLSRKGIKELSKAVDNIGKKEANRLGLTLDKLAKEAPDVAQKVKLQARQSIADKITREEAEKGASDLVSKAGVGFEVPFTDKGFRAFDLPKIPGAEKFGEAVKETLPFRTLSKIFQGRKKTLMKDMTPSKREASEQVLEEAQGRFNMLQAESLERIQEQIKPLGDPKLMNKMADAFELIDRTEVSTTKLIQRAKKNIDDMAEKGNITAKEATKIKKVMPKVTKEILSLERKMIDEGLLRKEDLTGIFPFPRKKADTKIKGGLIGQRLLETSKDKRRTIYTAEGLGDIGESVIVKKQKGKATVIGGTKSGVLQTEGARVLKEGENLRYVSPKNVKSIKEKIRKAADKKISKFKKERDELQENIKKLREKGAGIKTTEPRLNGKTLAQTKERLNTVNKRVIETRQAMKDRISEVERRLGKGDVFVSKDGKAFKLKEATAKEIEGKTDIKFEHASTSFERRMIKSNMRLQTKNMLQGMVRNQDEVSGLGIKPLVKTKKGKPTEAQLSKAEPDEGYVRLSSLISDMQGFEFTKKYQIPKEVAELFKKNFKLISEESEIDNMLKGYDKLQNYWKSFALVGIQYHTRNIVSNHYNMWLGDFRDFNMYKRSFSIMRKLRKEGGVKALTKQERFYLEQAKSHNVMQGHFFGSEIVESIEEQVKSTSWNPLSKTGFLVRGSQSLGITLEQWQRFAMYLDRIENKGESPIEAARSVKKYLFDYSDLTDFEQKVFKRVVPFYTWMRKNLPLQVESVITQPGKAATTTKFFNHIQADDADKVRENLPDWLKNGHPVVLPFKDDKGNPFVVNLEGILPVYDLTVIGEQPFHYLKNIVTPLFKTPAELSFNVDMFKDFREIDPTTEKGRSIMMDLFERPIYGESVRDKFWGGIFNPAQAHVIKTAFRPIRELDSLLQVGKTDEETYTAWQRVLKAVLLNAHPIDIMKQKSFNAYATQQNKDLLLDAYKSAYKGYIRAENNIDESNMERIQEQAQQMFDINDEAFADVRSTALRQSIKYEKLQEVVKSAKRQGRGVTASEIRDLAREYAETSDNISTKRARKILEKEAQRLYNL